MKENRDNIEMTQKCILLTIAKFLPKCRKTFLYS